MFCVEGLNMVMAEFKTPEAVVRIHDDCVEPRTEDSIARLSRIVSQSYQRRLQGDGEAAAAFWGTADAKKI